MKPPFKERRIPKGLRRGVSILPVLFTTGNLFFGFWAIIKTIHGELTEAAPLIGIAIVLDLLDGSVARMTGTTSEFGGELDSLSDLISFGVAPALMLYCWAFDGTLPRLGWLVAFLFVTCGALRLARFNVQRHVVDSRYFVGLPIPAAAAQVATVVFFAPKAIDERVIALIICGAAACLGLLMVSTLRYRSFKNLDLHSRRSYVSVLVIAGALVFIFLHRHGGGLLTVVTLYTVSGPIMHAVGLARRRGSQPQAVADEAH